MLATTLSIVAVFLPIGFMGGIIGKFFHEFGITIVAAVLISMFVSFTLDPMLSCVWHDPQAERATAQPGPSRRRSTTAPSAASPAGSTAAPMRLSRGLPGDPALVAAAQAGHARARRRASSSPASSMVPLLGTEFVPKADFSETQVNFYTPVGSSLEVTESQGAPGRGHAARVARGALHA